MVFLARFILSGPSQAALIAAAMAILGIIFAPAVWVSAAAIALVTLVKDHRKGAMVMVYATLGAALFSMLLFSSPLLVVYFILMAWLPAWLAAVVLKQTVSLASSLLLLAGLSLLAIIMLYVGFPDFGELWRQPLDELALQLVKQSQGQLTMGQLEAVKEMAIQLIPGLLACSILLGTMMSLFLARWWQSALMHPGGFGEEFKALQLGKFAALVAIGLSLAATVLANEITFAMMLVVFALYLTQGTAILHSVVAGRKLNIIWLYAIYVLMFLVPHVVVLLGLVGLVDAWIDIRKRLIPVA